VPLPLTREKQGVTMEFKVKINKEGLNKEDIKWVREKLSEISSKEMIHLLDGNTFSVARGCDENRIKLEFYIN
tara:strand:- start:2222 stop:2440 length:219 start_codon:yes stop_codon:yes gene_type:complete